MLGQDKHEAILREHLAKHNCHVELGVEFVSMTQNASEVRSILRHVDGTEEVAISKWLIGADGGKSAVRRVANVNFLGEERTEGSLLIGDVILKNSGDMSGDVSPSCLCVWLLDLILSCWSSTGTSGAQAQPRCRLHHF
jgi:2-polyprenyl-6-methoxyphenol hydroxylase-like FAD-dependent oxidoreductase